MTEALVPEIVEPDPFREFALTDRQYWVQVYEDARDLRPSMTLDEFLAQHWQNQDSYERLREQPD